MKRKWCTKCDAVKPVERFTYRNGAPDSWCRDCASVANRRWVESNPEYLERRKRSWKGNMKERVELVLQAKAKACADCGGHFHPVAMDFDHVRGTKVSEISTLLRTGAGVERLKAEIVKCDVVCSNCHRVRTHLRKGSTADRPYSIY